MFYASMPRTLNRQAAFKSAPSKLATLTRRFHHRCTRIAAASSTLFLFFSFLSLCRSVFLFLLFSPAVVFIFFVRPFESSRTNDRLQDSAKHRLIPLANVRFIRSNSNDVRSCFCSCEPIKGVWRNARESLTRVYLYILHRSWLSHALKFVCRNGVASRLMPSVTLIGGRI